MPRKKGAGGIIEIIIQPHRWVRQNLIRPAPFLALPYTWSAVISIQWHPAMTAIT
jgi:hypothetical protein